jgi:hypothetical protein
VAQTQQAYAYTSDDPVNEIDPAGMAGGAPDALLCGKPGHDCSNKGGDIFSWIRHHWRGIAKVAIVATLLVGTTACVAFSGGMCGGLAFTVWGTEFTGGSIAITIAAGAGRAAADYALDKGKHTLIGYLESAGIGAGEDAAAMGIPQEYLFGAWGSGAHSAELGFFKTVADLPNYLTKALSRGLHAR